MDKVNLSEKDVKAIARGRDLTRRGRWDKVRMVVGALIFYAMILGSVFGGMALLGDWEDVYVTASGQELRVDGNDRVLDGETMTKEPADLDWNAGVIALFVVAGVSFAGMMVVAYIKYDKKATALRKAFLKHWEETGEIPPETI